MMAEFPPSRLQSLLDPVQSIGDPSESQDQHSGDRHQRRVAGDPTTSQDDRAADDRPIKAARPGQLHDEFLRGFRWRDLSSERPLARPRWNEMKATANITMYSNILVRLVLERKIHA
jgi:hypothetical protein